MKSKIRFNIIDALLLLIIIAAVALAAYFVMSGRVGQQRAVSERPIQYTVLLTNVRGEFKGNIKIGDSVTDTVKLMPIGEVTDIKTVQTSIDIEDETAGRIVSAIVPDKYDITVTVTADATVSTGFYMIGGYQIQVGTLVSLRVPDFTGVGYCTSITEVN
ncbi:MAG: DUF4330 family protein [Clostridiales bacterium]|nr:DUF4330 family protein [Clostridiales bacterium]